MENFKPNIGKKVQENIEPETKKYRDGLAEDLKILRNIDPDVTQEFLNVKKEDEQYKKSQEDIQGFRNSFIERVKDMPGYSYDVEKLNEIADIRLNKYKEDFNMYIKKFEELSEIEVIEDDFDIDKQKLISKIFPEEEINTLGHDSFGIMNGLPSREASNFIYDNTPEDSALFFLANYQRNRDRDFEYISFPAVEEYSGENSKVSNLNLVSFIEFENYFKNIENIKNYNISKIEKDVDLDEEDKKIDIQKEEILYQDKIKKAANYFTGIGASNELDDRIDLSPEMFKPDDRKEIFKYLIEKDLPFAPIPFGGIESELTQEDLAQLQNKNS
jgi:hypothetical protein